MFSRMIRLTALGFLVATGTAAAQLPWAQQGAYDYRSSSPAIYRAYSNPVITPAAGTSSTRAYYPSSAGATPVSIRVSVPKDAEIWFNGSKTTQAGTQRHFVSAPITGGYAYSYEVRVRWHEDGRQVTQSRRVAVNPGDDISLTFGNTEGRP